MSGRKLLLAVALIAAIAVALTGCDGNGGQHTGQLQGVVVDSSSMALPGVTVTVYNQSAANIGTATTDSSGSYSLQSVTAGTGYHVTFVKAGYTQVDYYNVTIVANQIIYLEAVMQLTTGETATVGTVSGQITNALTGAGVDGLTISLRAGMNTTSGSIVATTTTATEDTVVGFYTFTNLQGGNYTAEVAGTGFVTTYFTVICVGGSDKPNQNYAITPILNPGETQIVLTWGASPSDLDSHLTGPRASGDTDYDPSFEEAGRFHVYFYNKIYNYNSITYADLDVDDTTSYGPETVTIRNQVSGLYRYSVHDYTNRGANVDNPSYALAGSGATVKVYRESTLVATFYVPPSVGANLWTVFELNGSTITPINTMTYVAGSGTVRSIDLDDKTIGRSSKEK